MNKKRFEVLDAFRGICALCVVVFHMRFMGSFTELTFFRNSEYFVEFFFILSGFVLSHGYSSKSNLTFFSFMRTRFFRLYPLHIFMLLVFLIIECGKFLAFRYGGFSFTNYPFTGAASPYELVPNILLIQSWAPSFDHLSFNFPSWSISVEFYVYAIFFLTISIFRRVRLVSWLSLIILSLYMLIDSCAFITAQALKGIFCFFLGAVIYKLYLYFDGEINFGYIFSTVIEFLLLCISIFVVAIEFNSKALFVPFLFSLVVFFYSLELGYFSSLLKWSGFQWLGKLSYSIYMTHAAMLFIIISMAIVLQKLLGHPIAPMVDAIRFIDFGAPYINNLLVLGVLISVILISSFTYRYIEVKGINLGYGKSKRNV